MILRNRYVRSAMRIMLLAGILAGAGVALASSGRSRNPHQHRLRQLLHSALIGEVPTAEASHFGILRRGQDKRIMLPRVQAQALGGLLGFGANPALARGAMVGTGAAWLIPANNGMLCLTLSGVGPDGGGAACTNTVAAADGQLMTWTSPAGSRSETIVDGVAPDGYSQVIFTMADGATQTLQVQDNMYGGHLPGPFVAFRFHGPAGSGPVVTQSSDN